MGGDVLVLGALGMAGSAQAAPLGAGAAGLAVPAQTSATADGSRTLLWMSPDELLLVLPRAETAGALAALTDALATEHSLVLDVSDMRAAFAIEGPKAEQVLMKLCPADIASMPDDGVRRFMRRELTPSGAAA